MNQDTNDLSMKHHAFLIAFAVLLIGGLAGHVLRSPASPTNPAQSRYHDASLDLETQPATTTQAYYEQERAGLHDLEDTDLETTQDKLDRIRRRDTAARSPSLNPEP